MKIQNKNIERRFFNDIANLANTSVGREQFDFIASNLYNSGIYLKGTMLEVGCGPQGYKNYFLETYWYLKVVGLDLSQESVKVANKDYPWAICGDAEASWIFKQGEFNVITCLFFLHHLPSIKQAMQNIDYWLKPGGILIIMDINPYNIMARISNFGRKIFERLGGTEYLIRHHMATPNETIHNVKEYLEPLAMPHSLKGYKVIVSKGFYVKRPHKNPSHILHNEKIVRWVLFHLANIYYKIMPPCKFSEQHILLILKKGA